MFYIILENRPENETLLTIIVQKMVQY